MKAAIAPAWATLFESVPFGEFERRLLECIVQFLKDFHASSPDSVKDRAKAHGEICREMVTILLSQAFTEARVVLVREQKALSRSLDTHVESELRGAYAEAAMQKGRGSVRRQKVRL